MRRRFSTSSLDVRTVTALVLSACLACSGKGASSATKGGTNQDPNAIRYRLKLRHNAVDPGAAFRCYGKCQSVADPKAYVECLSSCPGFEKTVGVACDAYEIPPETACLTVHKVPAGKEPEPGLVVLAVVGGTALVVGLASLCNLSSSHCEADFPPPR